jgi:hypothetical protein
MTFAREAVTSRPEIPYSWQVSRIGNRQTRSIKQKGDSSMKDTTRCKVYLTMAAMILTVALANRAAAQTSCADYAPGCFKGIFQGQDAHETNLPPGATKVLIRTIASGIGTHFNQFLLVREVTGDLVNFTATGSAQWVAANREDSIYTTVAGNAVPDFPAGVLKVTETHTITGGTGRFTGAQGKLDVVLFHKFQPSGVAGGFQTHDISGSFQGTITFPGPAR